MKKEWAIVETCEGDNLGIIVLSAWIDGTNLLWPPDDPSESKIIMPGNFWRKIPISHHFGVFRNFEVAKKVYDVFLCTDSDTMEIIQNQTKRPYTKKIIPPASLRKTYKIKTAPPSTCIKKQSHKLNYKSSTNSMTTTIQHSAKPINMPSAVKPSQYFDNFATSRFINKGPKHNSQ